MANLALSFSREKCKSIGCSNTGGVYGVCKEHESSALNRYFNYAASDGLCDYEPPPCFRNRQEWVEYVVAFMLCRNSNERQKNRIDYCRDCTPEYQEEQIRAGKCTHRETVFIRPVKSTDDVMGVSFDQKKRSNSAWENAMLGAAGEIVKLPTSEVMNDRLLTISENSKPRKRGPKPK